YVATGTTFPDALAGAALAGSQGVPVLLTTRTSLPAATAQALARLQPGRIVVLGDSGAVSDAVADALASYTSGSVTRLAGADRYATAAAVAAQYAPGVETAYVATGTTFPDALAGAALAGSQGMPVLLTAANAVPMPLSTAFLRLAPQQIVVLGDSGAVSDPVASSLGVYGTG
ncbi:MAG TPA: cell wall-binding repeat-containing protein, partial [Actinomycetes bacterium]|nr:cell wall-binding repeat-containing protein [Actinomycetes bacterium]